MAQFLVYFETLVMEFEMLNAKWNSLMLIEIPSPYKKRVKALIQNKNQQKLVILGSL
jgi:hypothetical protein